MLNPSPSPLFVYALRQVGEAAARAAYEWIGRGRKKDGDGAAVHAMRAALGRLGIGGVVVIDEGATSPRGRRSWSGRRASASRSPRRSRLGRTSRSATPRPDFVPTPTAA